MSKWVQGRVAGTKHWTDRLVSLEVEAPEVTFVAGQFGRLALPAPPGAKEDMVGRPYSFVNPPGRAPHEFFFNVRARGTAVAAPRRAGTPGDPLWLLPNANGFFTIAEVPEAPSAVVPVDGHRPRPVPVDPAHRRSRGRSSSGWCSCTRCASPPISPIAT